MFQQRTDAYGRPLKWYQSSTHSVVSTEEYHRGREVNPHYYDTEWDQHPQYKVRVEPGLSYQASVLQNFRKIIVVFVATVALIVVIIGFMIMGAMQTTVSQQIHPNVQDGKVCGHSYTHDGTPITLKSQTDTSFDLNGHVYSSTNCGY